MPRKPFKRLVRPAGLEPTTPGLEGRCSIQLSYGRLSDSLPARPEAVPTSYRTENPATVSSAAASVTWTLSTRALGGPTRSASSN